MIVVAAQGGESAPSPSSSAGVTPRPFPRFTSPGRPTIIIIITIIFLIIQHGKGIEIPILFLFPLTPSAGSATGVTSRPFS